MAEDKAAKQAGPPLTGDRREMLAQLAAKKKREAVGARCWRVHRADGRLTPTRARNVPAST
jgi:hypothetical protein